MSRLSFPNETVFLTAQLDIECSDKILWVDQSLNISIDIRLEVADQYFTAPEFKVDKVEIHLLFGEFAYLLAQRINHQFDYLGKIGHNEIFTCELNFDLTHPLWSWYRLELDEQPSVECEIGVNLEIEESTDSIPPLSMSNFLDTGSQNWEPKSIPIQLDDPERRFNALLPIVTFLSLPFYIYSLFSVSKLREKDKVSCELIKGSTQYFLEFLFWFGIPSFGLSLATMNWFSHSSFFDQVALTNPTLVSTLIIFMGAYAGMAALVACFAKWNKTSITYQHRKIVMIVFSIPVIYLQSLILVLGLYARTHIAIAFLGCISAGLASLFLFYTWKELSQVNGIDYSIRELTFDFLKLVFVWCITIFVFFLYGLVAA